MHRHPPRPLTRSRGFTLVELMIVVALIGILAALAVYGVSKYIINSKTAEARNAVGRMAHDAATAYAREGMASTKLNLGSSTGLSNRLCGSMANPVPGSPDSIKGRKYQASPTEWETSDKDNGWQCLKFSMDTPQYYMYGYQATGTQGVGASFIAASVGDLDGDGTVSSFTLSGTIQSDNGNVVLTMDPNFREDFPME